MPLAIETNRHSVRQVLYQRIVFWALLPVAITLMRLLSDPTGSGPNVIIFAFNLAMVLLIWTASHFSTELIRQLFPVNNSGNSLARGLAVLSLGSILGSLLLFPTRPLRIALFCKIAQPIGVPCYVIPPMQFDWDLLSTFMRLSMLGLLYWLTANYIVASLFNTTRYGVSLAYRKVPLRTGSATADEDTSPLLARIPLELGDDIILLAANQHYIDVHTRKGNALVLYRLSDAVTELGDRGMQVHRSYWVAHDAISKVERYGATFRVTLENGQSVPVSRGYQHLFRTPRFERLQLS